MLKGVFAAWPRSACFWILVAFLVLTFFTGGSARGDVQALAILRPISVIILGIGFCTLSLDHIRAHKWLFIAAFAVVFFVLLQIIPLPDALRSVLLNEDIVADVAAHTFMTDKMQPIAIAPSATLNSLFALVAPLAALVFSVQLSREERFALLPVLIILALCSGLLGLLQAVGNPGGRLYFYQITNVESAVGLFANRNHQATLLALLFPMLAVYASAGIRTQHQGKIKSIMAMALAAILIPLLLVTGSRTGLLIGLFGVISALILYKAPPIQTEKKATGWRFNPLFIIGGLAVVTLGALSIMLSRAQAVQRLAGFDQNQDLRFQIWQPIIEFAANFLPVGSGMGSFSIAYQVHEPPALLGPAIVNQAHNDWLDLLLTTGYPGVLLAILAGIGFVSVAWTALRSPMKAGSRVQFSRLGAVTTFLVVIAALVDYALRTPIIAVVFVICLIWMRSIFEDRSSHNKFSNHA